MNEDTASRGKRVRFDNPTSTLNESQPVTSPKNTAIQSITDFSTTLPKAIAPIALDIGNEYIDWFTKLHRKTKAYNKMEDDPESFPRSVSKMKDFALRASLETSRTEEFNSLKEETNNIIENFKVTMKKQVLACLRLEIKNLRNHLHEQFVTAVHTFAQAQLVLTQDEEDPHNLITILFELEHDKLLKNIDLTGAAFDSKYQEIHNLDIFPQPYGDTQTGVEKSVILWIAVFFGDVTG